VAERRYATFTVEGVHLAVDVAEVQEVIRAHPVTAVPRAPHVIAGLMNLRGQIVTVVDLRRRLELPPAPPDRPPVHVVLRTGGDAVSLLVDGIGDVLEADDAALAAPPATLRGVARDLVVGVHALDARLVLVLDVRRVLGFHAGAVAS
jgi:purine-binding chemotaxis protein CheW